MKVAGFGADGPVEGGPEIVRENPARHGEVVGTLLTTDADGVGRVIAGAAEANAAWSATPLEERVERLRIGARAVADSADELAPLLASELGKPVADSAGEMGFAAAFLAWVCDRVGEVCADRVIDDDAGRVVVRRVPYGVISAIVPWNAPLILSSLKVAPALATGNVIVVKPSPLAPFAVTEALRRLAEHLPPGVLSVVHGEVEVGNAMVTDPRRAQGRVHRRLGGRPPRAGRVRRAADPGGAGARRQRRRGRAGRPDVLRRRDGAHGVRRAAHLGPGLHGGQAHLRPRGAPRRVRRRRSPRRRPGCWCAATPWTRRSPSARS